jgi:hypothetical protein
VMLDECLRGQSTLTAQGSDTHTGRRSRSVTKNRSFSRRNCRNDETTAFPDADGSSVSFDVSSDLTTGREYEETAVIVPNSPW